MTALPHVSVLADEAVHALAPRSGGCYIDCTLGAAGHAVAVLESSSPDGRLLGLDADPDALRLAADRLGPYAGRAVLVHSKFSRVQQVATEHGFTEVDGILMDLGLSSMQLDLWNRGFSFRRDEPLDMRFDPTAGVSAAELIESSSEQELADIIWQYGEEPASRRIARAIKRSAVRVETSGQLAALVQQAAHRPKGRTHPATRTFQALRIAVNNELEELRAALDAAVRLLRTGGRLAVISFHSLEDRIVKQFMRRESSGCICPPHQPVCRCEHRPTLKLIDRRALRADADQLSANPRSRSAKLRVAERVQGE